MKAKKLIGHYTKIKSLKINKPSPIKIVRLRWFFFFGFVLHWRSSINMYDYKRLPKEYVEKSACSVRTFKKTKQPSQMYKKKNV